MIPGNFFIAFAGAGGNSGSALIPPGGGNAFQFVNQVALNVHMVRGDQIGIDSNFFDFSVSGVSYTGQKVHQPPGGFAFGGFQIQHHGLFLLEVIRDFRGTVEPFRFHQHNAQLTGRVNTQNFSAPVFHTGASLLRKRFSVADFLIVFLGRLILVRVRMGKLFQFIKKPHRV